MDSLEYSLETAEHLQPHIRTGLITIAVLAIFSLVASGAAIGFMVFRLFDSSIHQQTPLRYNQSIILILNLLLADLQQACSFALSLYWVEKDAIIYPSSACNAQAWMVQVGDLSSGLFSLAIAMQTFYIIVVQREVPYKTFVFSVVSVWIFCVGLSLISPILHRNEVLYVNTGGWCWLDASYQTEVNETSKHMRLNRKLIHP